MGSDLDYSHPEVEEDVLNWGKWLADTVPLKGFRFDASHTSAGACFTCARHCNSRNPAIGVC